LTILGEPTGQKDGLLIQVDDGNIVAEPVGIPHGFVGPSETAQPQSKRIVLPGNGDGGSIRSGKMSAIPEASQGSTEVKGDEVERAVDLLGDEAETTQEAPEAEEAEAEADAVAERVKAIIPIEREEAGDPDVLEAELVLEGDSGNSSETELGAGSKSDQKESNSSAPATADANGGEGEDENTALLSNGPRAGAGAGAGANGDGKGKDKKKKKKKGKK
jgi:hypothetical protein